MWYNKGVVSDAAYVILKEDVEWLQGYQDVEP